MSEGLAHVEWVGQLCDLTKAGERLARAVRQAFDNPQHKGAREDIEAALSAYEQVREAHAQPLGGSTGGHPHAA